MTGFPLPWDFTRSSLGRRCPLEHPLAFLRRSDYEISQCPKTTQEAAAQIDPDFDM